MPKYQPTGKRPGRPRIHDTAQRCLGVRIDLELYERLAQSAQMQKTTLQRFVEQALGGALEPQQSPDLGVIDAGLLAMGEAASALEARCSACPTCKPHVTATLNVAWPKLTAALDALSPDKEAA
jgi:hypothetical protein